MELLKRRVYPVNVKTGEVFVGHYTDGRIGFPNIATCFDIWKGTDVTGFYGRHLKNLVAKGKLHLMARSIWKESKA